MAELVDKEWSVVVKRDSGDLVYAQYTPGPQNADSYREGWTCDNCGFTSVLNSSSAMSRTRFHSPTTNSDLCIVCGRKQLPVYQLLPDGETSPAVFHIPKLNVSIPSYKATVTGAGATYNIKVSDAQGNSWNLSKTYTDFEVLHQRLKGITWSDDAPPRPPFPAKDMFPKVSKRAQMFAAYISSVCARLSELDDKVHMLIVRFLQATYPVESRVSKVAVGSGEGVHLPSATVASVRGLALNASGAPHEPEQPSYNQATSSSYSMASPAQHITPVTTPMKLAAQHTAAATPPSLRKMRQAKTMLEEGLITQEDYDSMKSSVLSSIVSQTQENPSDDPAVPNF